MSAAKTIRTEASVAKFLEQVDNPVRRADSHALLELMREVTGEKAVMWGDSIVGFGSYHYVYASGREGDWPLTGFSPRKQNLAVYIMTGFSGHEDLMARLGKHRTGKSCLYINELADVDLDVLRKLVRGSVQAMRKKYS